uniref:Uncharacterized protein n=1 Tax=Neospora caninum (strain Liverpool) TaxID=572307 RepID=A0A0F7U9S2_NEOCL|nr:TPA: hypothetical protein BN1204_023980 [Neospora caninum Liverpool]
MRKQLAERPAAYALCFDWREAFADPAAAPALVSPASHAGARRDPRQPEAPSAPATPLTAAPSASAACHQASPLSASLQPCCRCCLYNRELRSRQEERPSAATAGGSFLGTKNSPTLEGSDADGNGGNGALSEPHAGPGGGSEDQNASGDRCPPGSPHCCRNENADGRLCCAQAALQSCPASDETKGKRNAEGESEHAPAAIPRSPQVNAATDATETLVAGLDAREVAIARAERAALALIERIRDRVHRKKVAPKMILFVILPAGLPDPQGAVGCLRRLNPSEIAALFVTCGIDDIQTKMERLEQVAYDCAVEHYENEARRYRKQIHHAPKCADRSQSNACHVYHVRSLVKAGYMLEFAGQPHGAMKSFIAAWQLLTTDKQMATAVERVALCNVLSVRMYHMYFQANEPAKAAHHAREHRAVLRENPEDEELFGYLLPQWLAELHELLAHLQQEALLTQHRLHQAQAPAGPDAPASPSLASGPPAGRRHAGDEGGEPKRQGFASALGFGRNGREGEGLGFFGANGLHFNKWGLGRDAGRTAPPSGSGARGAGREAGASHGETSLALFSAGADELGAPTPSTSSHAFLGFGDAHTSLSQMVYGGTRPPYQAGDSGFGSAQAEQPGTHLAPDLLSLTTEAWENPGFHFQAAARYLQELRVWVRRAKVQLRPPSMKGGLAVPSEWIGQLDTLQHGVEAFSLIPHTTPGAAAALMRQEILLRWIFSVNEQQVSMHATRLLSKAHAIYKCIGGTRGCPVIACQLADALFDSQRMLTARQLYATLAQALSVNLFNRASLLSSSFCAGARFPVGGCDAAGARDGRGEAGAQLSRSADAGEAGRPSGRGGENDAGHRGRERGYGEISSRNSDRRARERRRSREETDPQSDIASDSEDEDTQQMMWASWWWPLLEYVLARLLLSICSLLSLAPPPFLYDLAHVNPLFHCIEARHAPSSLSQSVGEEAASKSASPQDDLSSNGNSVFSSLSSLDSSSGGPDSSLPASSPGAAHFSSGEPGPFLDASGASAFPGNDAQAVHGDPRAGHLHASDGSAKCAPATCNRAADAAEAESRAGREGGETRASGPSRVHAEGDERHSGGVARAGVSASLPLQALAPLPSFLDFENYRIGVLCVFELMNLFALRAGREDPEGEKRRQLRAFLLLALLPKLQHLVESEEGQSSPGKLETGHSGHSGFASCAPNPLREDRRLDRSEEAKARGDARRERGNVTVSLPGVVAWLAFPNPDELHREAVALWRREDARKPTQKASRARGEAEVAAPGDAGGRKKRRSVVQGVLCLIQRFGLDLEVASRGVLVTSRGPLPCRLLPLASAEEDESARQLPADHEPGDDLEKDERGERRARENLRDRSAKATPRALVSSASSVASADLCGRRPYSGAAAGRPGVVIPSESLCCFRLMVYPFDGARRPLSPFFPSPASLSAPLRVLGLAFKWQLCRFVTFTLSTLLPLDTASPPPQLEPGQMKQVRRLRGELRDGRGREESMSSRFPFSARAAAGVIRDRGEGAGNGGQDEEYGDISLDASAAKRIEPSTASNASPESCSSFAPLLDVLAEVPRGSWPQPVRHALLQKRLSVPPPPMPPSHTGEDVKTSPLLFLPGTKPPEDVRPDRFFRVGLSTPAFAWKDEIVPLVLRIVKNSGSLPSHLSRCRLLLFASHEAAASELVSSRGAPGRSVISGAPEAEGVGTAGARPAASAFLEETGAKHAPGLDTESADDGSKRETDRDTGEARARPAAAVRARGEPEGQEKDGEERPLRRDGGQAFFSAEPSRLQSRENRLHSWGWPARAEPPHGSFESLGGLVGRVESLVAFAAFLEERGEERGLRGEAVGGGSRFRALFPVSVSANRPVLSLDFDGLGEPDAVQETQAKGLEAGEATREGGVSRFRVHQEPPRGGNPGTDSAGSSESARGWRGSKTAGAPSERPSGCPNCLAHMAAHYRALGYNCEGPGDRARGEEGETLILSRPPRRLLAGSGGDGEVRDEAWGLCGAHSADSASSFLFENDMRELARDPSDASRSSVRLFTFRPSRPKARFPGQPSRGGSIPSLAEGQEGPCLQPALGESSGGRSGCSTREMPAQIPAKTSTDAEGAAGDAAGFSPLDCSPSDPHAASAVGRWAEASPNAEGSSDALNRREEEGGERATGCGPDSLGEEIAVPLLFRAKAPGAVQIRVVLEFPSRPRCRRGPRAGGEGEAWQDAADEEAFLDLDPQEDFVTAAGSILVQNPVAVQLQAAPFAAANRPGDGEEQTDSPRGLPFPPENAAGIACGGVAPLAYLHLANPSSISLRLDDVRLTPLATCRPEGGEKGAGSDVGRNAHAQTAENRRGFSADDGRQGGGTEPERVRKPSHQEGTASENACTWRICSECGTFLPSSVSLTKRAGGEGSATEERNPVEAALSPPLIGCRATVESLEAWSAIVDLEGLLRSLVSTETASREEQQSEGRRHLAAASEYAVRIRFKRHSDSLPYPFNVFSSLFEPREQIFPFSLLSLLPACVDLSPVTIRVTHAPTPTVGVPFTLRATITNNTADPQEATVQLVYPPAAASVEARLQAESDLAGDGPPESARGWSRRSDCPYLITGIMSTDLLLSPASDRVMQWTLVACRAGAFSVPTVVVQCHRCLSGTSATPATVFEEVEDTAEPDVAQQLSQALREAIEGDSPQAPDSSRGGSVFMSHLTHVVVFPNPQRVG